jgi:hypothetical protein
MRDRGSAIRDPIEYAGHRFHCRGRMRGGQRGSVGQTALNRPPFAVGSSNTHGKGITK